MGKERSRKKPSFGVIFWIAVILLVLVVLVFNLPSIRDVLDSTGFVDVVFEPRDQDAPSRKDKKKPDVVKPDLTDPGTAAPAPTEQTESADRKADDPSGDPVVEIGEPESTRQQEIVVPPPEPQSPEGQEQTRTTVLYFIRVSDDGRILAEPVKRPVRSTGGPLTAAVNALISGPNADDHNKGLLSLIPGETELLSARVADGVAYLNFNEAFRFNPMGREGYLAQMQQVVQTATEFSTVDRVQILINGQIVEYLGGDGIYIGKPLSPGDLRR